MSDRRCIKILDSKERCTNPVDGFSNYCKEHSVQTIMAKNNYKHTPIIKKISKFVKSKILTSTILLIICIVGLMCFSIGFGMGEHRNQWAVEEVKEYRENFKFLTGWGHRVGDYQLVTFDGGKNWYNYKYEKDKGLVILGSADSKFLTHHERMRDLIERAKQGEKPIVLFYREDK